MGRYSIKVWLVLLFYILLLSMLTYLVIFMSPFDSSVWKHIFYMGVSILLFFLDKNLPLFIRAFPIVFTLLIFVDLLILLFK
ncbi:hypothetical protein EEL32_03715 [Brevibacillus laterosporus]|nr:hypothetical protein EEL32_03715 [Brevibacillus laterosporus]